MPDSYSDLFLQTTDLKLKGPLFTETTKILRPRPASGNLVQRVPLSFFTFLTLPAKPDDTEGHPFQFFSALFFENIFCLQRFPRSILLKFPLVKYEVKRYIRTFDVISELYCFLLMRRRWFESILKTALVEPLDIAPTLDVPVFSFPGVP